TQPPPTHTNTHKHSQTHTHTHTHTHTVHSHTSMFIQLYTDLGQYVSHRRPCYQEVSEGFTLELNLKGMSACIKLTEHAVLSIYQPNVYKGAVFQCRLCVLHL